MQIRPYMHTLTHTYACTYTARFCRNVVRIEDIFINCPKYWLSLGHMPWFVIFLFFFACAWHNERQKGAQRPQRKAAAVAVAVDIAADRLDDIVKVQPICSVFTCYVYVFFLSVFTTCSHRQARTQRVIYTYTHTQGHSRARRCIGIYKKTKNACTAACLGRQAAVATENGLPQLPLQCLLFAAVCDCDSKRQLPPSLLSVDAATHTTTLAASSMSESAAAFTTVPPIGGGVGLLLTRRHHVRLFTLPTALSCALFVFVPVCAYVCAREWHETKASCRLYCAGSYASESEKNREWETKLTEESATLSSKVLL